MSKAKNSHLWQNSWLKARNKVKKGEFWIQDPMWQGGGFTLWEKDPKARGFLYDKCIDHLKLAGFLKEDAYTIFNKKIKKLKLKTIGGLT